MSEDKDELGHLITSPICGVPIVWLTIARVHNRKPRRFNYIVTVTCHKWWKGIKGFKHKRNARRFSTRLYKAMMRRRSDCAPGDDGKPSLCNAQDVGGMIDLALYGYFGEFDNSAESFHDYFAFRRLEDNSPSGEVARQSMTEQSLSNHPKSKGQPLDIKTSKEMLGK